MHEPHADRQLHWDVANLIRDTFKRGKYQDVILPLTVLLRLDCVLAPTKDKVLARKAELRGLGLDAMDAQLKRVSGFAFYNTSQYNFERLLADAPELAANLRNYIVGFSSEMREATVQLDQMRDLLDTEKVNMARKDVGSDDERAG